MDKKVISVATSCYNERENIPLFYDRVRAAIAREKDFDYEFVVADNCSTDGTRDLLRDIAARDPKFKVILNANNFGHIRSPYNALMHTSGDLVFYLCSDLQEPPEMLEQFMAKWREGYMAVCGVKPKSKENPLVFMMRKFYYFLIAKFSETPQRRNFTGFGLYDRKFIDALRQFHEPYPYFRGLVGEVGMAQTEVEFVQEKRQFGRTKNNFFTLYDMAMTGFVNHTKLPLRLAVVVGFLLGMVSFCIAMVYLVLKLLWWDTFELGLAPVMIGLFFFASIQLIFIGVIGEYLGAIWVQVKDKPLVIAEEMLNFDKAKPRDE